jgi:hypothetical protein
LASRTSKIKERLKALKLKRKSIKRKSLHDVFIAGPTTSYKKRMQKEKDALAKEGRGIRIVAFILTLISMMLALSFIPFFPQPLPILVAVLVAFGVYMSPAVGMSIGSIPVALGLLYHLSTVDFIAMLGPAIIRVLIICILIFFFGAIPIRFRRYEDAVGINLGIIAACLLFFDSTFFLAIPLLITTAVLFKRTQTGLAIAYYALISVPLMLMQYFLYILTITRVDFWNDPTTVPPIYTSLSSVFAHMQGVSMFQFRMFDMSQTFGRITWEVIASPSAGIHTVPQALNQYMDSFPGMIMFLIMVGGIVWVVSLLLPSVVSKSGAMQAEILFPSLTATGLTALFFLFMVSLQTTMAFSAPHLTTTNMVLGTLATMVFAVPATILNFTPKKKAEIEKNCQIILVKTGSLTTNLQAAETLLAKIKADVPVDISGPETKIDIIKDKLNDIITKAKDRKFKVPETYDAIKELDKDLALRIDGLLPELDEIVKNYQLTLNYEYTAWIKKLQEIGYDVQTPAKVDFQKEQSTEERIQYISATLAASRLLANDVCRLATQVYEVIQTMYDPELPAQSRTISYVQQKLADKTSPWIACDALIIALKSWKRQYSKENAKSITALQENLTTLTNLANQEKTLLPILGERYGFVVEQAQRAQELQVKLEKSTTNLLTIMGFRDSLLSSLDVAKNVLSTLHMDMVTKANSVETMQPVEDFWEKNPTLTAQTADAIDKLGNPKKYSLNEKMKALPDALSCIEPCLWTISQYNVKNELLLNYPVAKTAIEEQLKKKKHVSAADLPFAVPDAEQYLKLFYNENTRGYTYDEENLQLTKKP